MNKQCTKCKQYKSILEFIKNTGYTKDGLHPWCKSCISKNKKEYWKRNKIRLCKAQRSKYHKNPNKYIALNKNYRNQKRQWLNEYKTQCGCVQCNEKDPRCLDFHHVNSSSKEFTIGEGIKYSINKIKKEILKCIILCANCHRKIN